MSHEIEEKQSDILNRREILKGLATVPVLGFFFVKLWQKMRLDKLKKSNLLQNLVKDNKSHNQQFRHGGDHCFQYLKR
jgi:hypothetical protein